MSEPIKLNLMASAWLECTRRFLFCQIPIQIFFGGSSSGKSVFLARRAVVDVATQERNYLITRNVAKDIRRSVFTEVEKAIFFLGLRTFFNINRTDMVMTCTASDRQIFFCGLDDPEKLKSIVPLNGPITDIWQEEATADAEAAHNQLSLRMRGRSSVVKRHTMSFNPITERHWIRKRYFSGVAAGIEVPRGIVTRTKDLLIHKSTYLDNSFLEDDDHARIEHFKKTDPYYYQVYGLGNWGVLGNVVFDNWSVEDLTDYKDTQRAYCNGLDFGFAKDPSAFTRSAIRGDDLLITDGFYAHGLTNPELARRLRPIVGNEIVWCDCAEPKSIQELRECNINARAVSKGKDSINHGIQWLRQRRILVDTKLQWMANEMSLYCWSEDKWGNPLPNPVDRDNHGIDSLRYGNERNMVGFRPLLVTPQMIRESRAKESGRNTDPTKATTVEGFLHAIA